MSRLHVIVHRSINGTRHYVHKSTYTSSSLLCHVQLWVFNFLLLRKLEVQLIMCHAIRANSVVEAMLFCLPLNKTYTTVTV